MNIQSFDHIVLCVHDVQKSIHFYTEVLGMEAREERRDKWALHFGNSKISLQDAESIPEIAKRTVPGSGNFCMLTDTPISQIVTQLEHHQVEILDGPAEKIGATGSILSVYFNDPDGNLVEISNRV